MNSFKEIDLSYLESIADGDIVVIKELISIFLEQVPEFTEGLSTHFEKQEWKEIAGLAHKAKSSVISMGMNDLGNIDLKNLELIAKCFRIEQLQKSIDITEKEKEELKYLEHNINNLDAKKKKWVYDNISEEIMNDIIKRFVFICNNACVELKTVLEN
jgi:HPt (histidine-containing phosphotransfer) domain-containing protein